MVKIWSKSGHYSDLSKLRKIFLVEGNHKKTANLCVTFFRTILLQKLQKKSQEAILFPFIVTHDKKGLYKDDNIVLTYSERCEFM